MAPSWSEALGAALQLGKAPGDGLSTKEGAKGLAGLGLGIGSLSEGRLRGHKGKELQTCWGVCEMLNHLNHVDTPSGQSRHWLGCVPKGPQLWSRVCACAHTYSVSGARVCLCLQAHATCRHTRSQHTACLYTLAQAWWGGVLPEGGGEFGVVCGASARIGLST